MSFREKLNNTFSVFGNGLLGSYSQIFFSNNRLFAVLLLLASFSDPITGVSGLISALAAIMFANWMSYNPYLVKNGTYSYNSLLVGLTMAVFFKFSIAFIVVLFLISFFTLLLTVWLSSVTSVYRVPFLSLPFILGVWTLLLSARSFGALQLSERGIYTFNELWNLGGPTLVNLYVKINSFSVPFVIQVYLKSLGAIFFQYNILSGLLIAIGLLIYSRISFTLSFLGFFAGYMFCYFVQGNLSELDYSYIGFNYILSAIAIGGFFLIPSPRTYLLAIISAPLIALFISAMGKILGVYQLPLYSLPFTMVVILLIFALNNRYAPRKLNLVIFQQFSPEKNLYGFRYGTERFKKDTYIHIQLPFYGEWTVSQGHEGKITHREDWRYAWDFVVTDDTKKTFKLPGKEVSDFYCYNLPVLAPAAGYVVNLIDGIDDNPIGDVNLGDNWGNTIIIKHSDFLYSKISHVKKGSFKVKLGDYVSRGDALAACGNSGRSPEPHIHFQLQTNALVAAKTILYPISYYAGHRDNSYSFHSFEYPQEGENVLITAVTPFISQAFHFIPGIVMDIEEQREEKTNHIKWEVFVDASNQSYIYCHATRSLAYFVNNGTLHYFTAFVGDKKSLLYYFYLGAHKVLLSYFQGMEVNDDLPIEGFHGGAIKLLQDFVAPFHIFLQAKYSSVYKEVDDLMNPGRVILSSSAMAKAGNTIRRDIQFELELTEKKLNQFTIRENEICIKAKFSVS
ncbi:MAG TPA: urea transporter [Bacteroidia bacterium]|nr:urea transporter [Bacteroidia bacterium]